MKLMILLGIIVNLTKMKDVGVLLMLLPKF